MKAAAIAALALCAFAGTASAQEARAELLSRFTGTSRCVDIAQERGLPVPRMADCSKAPTQAWVLRRESGTPWDRLQTADNTDLCLDVIADGPNDRLWMGPCGNYGSQFWILKPASEGQGAVWLTNAFTGPQRCLEVINDGAANDTIRMKPCDVWSSQKWTFRPLP